MPCLHKFSEYLNPDRLNFVPNTLIIGTFNPNWPGDNQAPWFYGRTQRNYFWDVLPRLYNHPANLRNQTHVEWKAFCSSNGIIITDFITSIDDAEEDNEEHSAILGTYLDTAIADYFNAFTYTNIPDLLDRYPSIVNVYLTRQEGIEMFDTQWALIENYSARHADRNMHLKRLTTPSANARFQMRAYKAANPQDPTPLRNFIYQKWLEQWHNI